MARFLIQKIARFVLLMLAVSFITFTLIHISPIDPVQANVGQSAYISMSAEKRAQLEEYWGVGSSLWDSYTSWLVDLLGGDLGTSLRYNAPVIDVIAGRALTSLALMATAWILSGLLGCVLGVCAALARGHLIDRLIKGYCYVLASTPTFWLGLIMLLVFSVRLKWFPIGFSVPIGVNASDVTVADTLYHLVLPALTLSFVGVANIALHTREKTIDVLESDYVRFARMRGLSKRQVLFKHGLRNLVIPAITLQFASISEIIGGSVLVEQVFSYPGLGQATITAGLGADAPLLAGIALFTAALVFGGNALANILYGVIDPRIRIGAAGQTAGRAGKPSMAKVGECDD